MRSRALERADILDKGGCKFCGETGIVIVPSETKGLRAAEMPTHNRPVIHPHQIKDLYAEAPGSALYAAPAAYQSCYTGCLP